VTQASGGVALGLIALFSSYDHITFAGRNLPISQQWGIPLIAASMAIIVVDAELATRSRLRAAQDALRAANEQDRERNRAAEARERQAREAQRLGSSLGRLHQTAVLSARLQLDPSDANRARLQALLALISQPPPEEEPS
jgi:hypothetical protein